jgi:pimeloyl-ACP methyl ester carboxylesterase
MTQAPEPESCFYNVAGLRLHYLVWGNEQRKPLLMVHGGRDHARIWDALASRLSEDYAVYVPDLRGHGDSDWAPASEYSIAGFVLDLAGLLREILAVRPEGQRIDIIGHSRGAGVAIRLAGTYPERFAHVIAIDGIGRHTRWGDPAPERLRSWVERRLEADNRPPRVYSDVEAAARRALEANPRLSPQVAQSSAVHGTRPLDGSGVVWKFDPRVLPHPPYDFPDDELREFCQAIEAPVLLVRGDESQRGEPRQEEWSHAFPNARSVILPGVGHWVQHEQPETLYLLVRDFLGASTTVPSA